MPRITFGGMKKLPKWPKGLKRRLAKAEARKAREAAIAARKKEIQAAKSRLKQLTK